MKKITGLLLAAVLCMPAYAAQTKNTMKMVSYFPVPYVAYDTVSANNAMDIGVLSQCEMAIKKGTSNLGGSACSLYLYGDPNAADLNSGLLNVTAGKLDLNSNVTNARIVSKKVQIGKDMTTIGGWLDIGIPSNKAKDYDALYISSLKNTGSSFRVTSKENGAKVNSFHMFNEISNDFPGCAGTVTWQELELAADIDKNETYTDVYLVCNGTGEVTPPQDCQAPNGLSYTESCPDGQEGNITFTWQGEPVCNYKETNNCKTVCQPTKGQSYTENCPSGQSGTITYTWDQSSCSYKKTENCIVGDCSDPYYKTSHKAECCPGTPTTDTVCWKQTYSWGPRTSVPVNTTVTYNAYYVSSSGERCNSSFALRYKSVYPDIVNSSASMLPCPGNDDRVKGQACYLRDIGTGPQDTYCFYSLGTGYEYASGVGFRGCKVISGRSGDTCECTISSWPGHECVANEPQKNGW